MCTGLFLKITGMVALLAQCDPRVIDVGTQARSVSLLFIRLPPHVRAYGEACRGMIVVNFLRLGNMSPKV